jgi:hypothetical protein
VTPLSAVERGALKVDINEVLYSELALMYPRGGDDTGRLSRIIQTG